VAAPAPPPPSAADPVLPPPPRRTGRFLLAGVLALVVLAGAALAAAWLVNGRDSAHPTAAAPATTAVTGIEPAAAPAAASAPSQSSAPSPSAASPSPPGDPNLVAADEFTGTAPQAGRWGLYESTDPNGAGWSPGMIRVVDGELRIAGTGRNPTGNGNRSGGLCWCGPDGDRTYGKWQVRARFDPGLGYGPVIGLWPHSDKGTDGSITFAVPGAARKVLYINVAWTSGGKPYSDGPKIYGDFTAWHVYTFEWRAGFVKIQIDGTVVYDSTKSATVVLPHIPMHFYMQQTVGPKDGVPAADAHTPD